MMENVFLMTCLIGGGLVICGYMLGRSHGYNSASVQVTSELFENKLADPMEVLRFYANQGNATAQVTLEKLNAERKAKFNEKVKDDATD
jgi:hypothetical protein